MGYDAGGLLVHSQELTIINLDHPGTIGYAIGSAMLSCSQAKVLHKEVLKPVVLLLGCDYACYSTWPSA